MSQLVVLLQEPDPGERRSTTTTILRLLRRGKMEGGLDQRRRKKSLKERLGLQGMGCCGGPIWGFRSTTIIVRDDDEGDTEIHNQLPQQPPPRNSDPTSLSGPEPAYDPIDLVLDPGCGVAEAQPAGSSMNLAAALAAERQYRASHEPDGDANGTRTRPDRNGALTEPGTPLRASLMRLLEETDGGYWEEGTDGGGGGGGGVGSEAMCCVCMARKKGAAFIPCGHTYCRLCSRELWLNRGSCPLCNRPILEILDIF